MRIRGGETETGSSQHGGSEQTRLSLSSAGVYIKKTGAHFACGDVARKNKGGGLAGRLKEEKGEKRDGSTELAVYLNRGRR